MKRTIAVLLALLMVLSLTACGGGNKDKDKLIGQWSNHTPYYSTYNPGTNTYISFESDKYYSFFKNNEFYYRYEGAVDLLTGSRVPRDEWTRYVLHGTYSMKDGIIILKYDESERDDEKIPYHINEYTKELMLDVNEKGESEWNKYSDEPKILTLD